LYFNHHFLSTTAPETSFIAAQLPYQWAHENKKNKNSTGTCDKQFVTLNYWLITIARNYQTYFRLHNFRGKTLKISTRKNHIYRAQKWQKT